MHDAVELMAVEDKVTLAVSRGMNSFAGKHNAAEVHIDELLKKLVMVPGDVNDLGFLAAFAKYFLDENVVSVFPVPFRAQRPAVDEIPDEVEIAAFALPQEFQQGVHLCVFGSEVNIRYPNGSKAHFLLAKKFRVSDHQLVLTQRLSLVCRNDST